jgi:hypothetical protein
MYTDNDILFPHHVIPQLVSLRGDSWRALVEHVTTCAENHESSLAFVLTMIRLNGCLGCETDSYRAMRGCAACAYQTLRRYKGSDDELIAQYERALADVRVFAASHPRLNISREPG